MGELIHLEDHHTLWLVVRERCAICYFCAVGVVNRNSDLDHQECGRCHAMTSAVTHYLHEQRGDGLDEIRRIVDPSEPEPTWVTRLVSIVPPR